MIHPQLIAGFLVGITVAWGLILIYTLTFPCRRDIAPLRKYVPGQVDFIGVRPLARAETTFQSQKGQDRWVMHTLRGKTNGYFVDLAANEPVIFSNTYYLEQSMNWSGLCIEANHRYFWPLVQQRKCQVIGAVVNDVEHQGISFRTDLGAGAGIIASDTDNNYRLRGKGKLRIDPHALETLSTTTLERILQQSHSPAVIDYLSLDIEGAEWRALSRFPFDQYTFLTLTIERPTPALNRLLFSQGYLYVKTDRSKSESFYVHESLPWANEIPKESFVQVPPKNI